MVGCVQEAKEMRAGGCRVRWLKGLLTVTGLTRNLVGICRLIWQVAAADDVNKLKQ